MTFRRLAGFRSNVVSSGFGLTPFMTTSENLNSSLIPQLVPMAPAVALGGMNIHKNVNQNSSTFSITVFVTQKRFASSTLTRVEMMRGQNASRLLKDTHPEIAMEVDTTQKNKMIPSQAPGMPPISGDVDLNTLSFDSGRRIPWKCKECGFQWVGSVMSRTVLKSTCPSCHRRNNPLLKNVDPKLWQEYEIRKNSIFLDPEAIEITSKERLFWCCGSCGCVFNARVCDRATGKAPCPECDRGHFADFKLRKVLLEEFHPTKNGDLTLAKLRPTDKLPVWWLCHECGHEYSMSVAIRVSNKKKTTTSCPKCISRRHVEQTAGVQERQKKRQEERAARGAPPLRKTGPPRKKKVIPDINAVATNSE